MKAVVKNVKRQFKAGPARIGPRARSGEPSRKERVLVEFPTGLLRQADEAARAMNRNRSELIRSAVERFLNEVEAKRFEEQLAAAYAANARMNRELCAEFEAVDREGF